MEPSPRSLILDLLSTLRSGSMPVAALVRAADLFGIGENRLRVALARLVAGGRVEAAERGRYRLGTAAEAVNRRVTGWRELESLRRSWTGGWVAVHTAAVVGAPRASRERRARALRFGGFRALERGLEVRPDNRAGGVAAARASLRELGLEADCPVFGLHELDPELEMRARSLWPTAELDAGYRESQRALERSRRELEGAARERAMVETFLLGGGVLRQLVFDPLLPDEILPSDPRRTLVEAMRAYDRFGRSCWAPFLRSAGVVGRRAPAHLDADRVMAAAGGKA